MAKATPMAESELATIIAPEIKDDAFYRLIEKLAAEERLDHVLEIGSSAGGGSTGAFLAGLLRNPGQPKLFCVEISKARFAVLQDALRPYPFAHCYNMSTVAVDEFPRQADVIAFYNSVPTGLNAYPIGEVLRWLQQDIDYVRDAGVAAGAIAQIKADHGISQFDLVLIDGSEFTGEVEFAKVDGARLILLDDTNTYKCHHVRQLLLDRPDYELIADDQDLRNGYSAFRRRDGRSKPNHLPIHFFTIVLNGEPFIRYHESVFARLNLRWHWHIVEGVAALKHDTAWSLEAGGRIPEALHDQGRSNDGTSATLDDLAARRPGQVTLYRKPLGEIWDGKREMVGAPLSNIKEEGLLWQVDSDELWTSDQIETVHRMFAREPDRTAASYWCVYFVGPRKIISTRFNFAQNPKQEWLRTWRYRPGDSWFAHEPPMLTRQGPASEQIDIAEIHPFTHDEMEQAGAVFQHFAYVLESQLTFKESYYGYKDARAQWRNLQGQTRPGLVRDHLKWVEDETIFDDVDAYPVTPVARDNGAGEWVFDPLDHDLARNTPDVQRPIAFDGAIWQAPASERRRFWTNILHEWARSGFAKNVTVLDRAGTAPRIEGLHYWTIPRHEMDAPGNDSLGLERACRMFGANLFMSSACTAPTETPSISVSFGAAGDAEDRGAEARHALSHAGSHVAVSPGVPDDGSRDDTAKAAAFRAAHGLEAKPYVMLAGGRAVTPAARAAIAAMGLLASDTDLTLLTSIDAGELRPLAAALAPKADIRSLAFSDETFLDALAGAHACVCPIGGETGVLTVLECCSHGCPAIVVGAPAVALGESVFVVADERPSEIAAALTRLLNADTRREHASQALETAQAFPIERAAAALADALLVACAAQAQGSRTARDKAGWTALREYQKRIEDERRATRASRAVPQSTTIDSASGSVAAKTPAVLARLFAKVWTPRDKA